MPIKLAYTPHGEDDVRGRILAKWRAYWQEYKAGISASNLAGERYEIACAIFNYRKSRFTHGNQITRWGTAFDKSLNIDIESLKISCGFNTEFDFVFPSSDRYQGAPHVQGMILGDAKDIVKSPGSDVKEILGYVLNEGLGGFCYQLPRDIFKDLLFHVHSVFAETAQVKGITGGDKWKLKGAESGHPSGKDIIAYFKPRYADLKANDYNVRYVQGQAYYTQELAQHAGFLVLCDSVPTMSHEELVNVLERQPF